MLVGGLTGGIGAGKSQLAGLLSQRGAAIIDTDEIVHTLLDSQNPTRDEVIRSFPETIREGVIDRQPLAERIFNDAYARSALESILHPAVFREVEQKLQQLDQEQIVVIEVPLLLETGTDRYDVVIAIVAPASQRRDRLRELGMSIEQIDGRMASQVDDEVFRSAADVVIVNDSDRPELEHQAGELWKHLSRLNKIKNANR